MMDYLELILAWILYLALHSFLASTWMKSKIPISARWYRLLYSIIATIGLLGLVYLMALIPPVWVYALTPFLKFAGMVAASWGVIIVVASFRQISMKAFLGLKKENNKELVKTGLHSSVRHPIYSGTILIMVGMFASVPSLTVLLTALVIFAYLPIGVYFEEKKLIDVFGQEYLDYKENVKAIIPGVL
ncbi:MAG: isoprenylcysteine carboxylmethyltransferase family protein [Cyclobacteriaceae bacterium]